ncbi:MAG TPA: DUF1570 domain-containing protein [Planctomycetes bacterium]|nr:DUF1570 domain-containing protein [Planctomycetota bacterium]HIL52582.1 DUF1570 domain-containing protein [Planctomycetota bacterium]
MLTTTRRATLRLLAACLIVSVAHADRLITNDGRVIEVKKARKEGNIYRLVFEHGEILCPDSDRIASIEMEGDMSDYKPQDENEQDKLDKGFVRYRGKWMSLSRYETEKKKEFAKAQERTAFLAEHSDWYNCWTKESKHFLVKTNSSPELLEYYTALLEAYYKLMDKRVGIKPTLSYRRKKMTVNIYKSREEFQKLSAAGVGPSTLGYFWSADDTLNFFHNYDEPAQSDWVALHECTHLLTFLIDQQYQPQIWLNEAVADYFGSAKITAGGRGKIEIEPGQLQTDRVLTVQKAIEDGKDTKLTELFFINRESFDGFQYAHAWSFVYFLNEFDGGKYQKGFQKFFKALYTVKKGIPYESISAPGPTGRGKRVSPEDIRDLLLKAIKMKDVELLEKQWKEFVKNVPIEGLSARLKRGLRSVMMGDFEDAILDLDQAIELGAKDPRAWASRGVAKAFTGSTKSGVKDLLIAVEKDPLNASFRNKLSGMLVGRISTGSARNSSSNGKLHTDEEAKRQAGLAMELDPENESYKSWYQRFE